MVRYYIISAFMFLSLIIINGCKEDNPLIPPSEHEDAEGWILLNSAQEPLLVVFEGKVQSEWKGSAADTMLTAPLNGESQEYIIKFLDHDGEMLEPDDDEDKTLGWAVSDNTVFDIEAVTDWSFKLKGRSAGSGLLELQVLHSGHVDIRTPQITVTVQ